MERARKLAPIFLVTQCFTNFMASARRLDGESLQQYQSRLQRQKKIEKAQAKGTYLVKHKSLNERREEIEQAKKESEKPVSELATVEERASEGESLREDQSIVVETTCSDESIIK